MNKRTLITLILSILLSSCSFIHIPNVQQGNILTASDIQKIHTGMTPQQVKNQLGSPLLTNIYASHKIIYSYSYKPGHGDLTTSHATITFFNNRVTHVSSNFKSNT